MGKPSSFYRLMLQLVLVNFCFGVPRTDVADGSVMNARSTPEPTTTPAPPCPAVVGSCPSGEWTRYYDTDSPVNDGDDFETVDFIRKTFGVRSVCPRPSAVEVRLAAGDLPCSHGENAVDIDTEGFACRADQQPDGRKCNNYKIRFCCPSRVGTCPGDAHWTTFHNRDRPTMSGDWEGRWKFYPQPGGCADGIPIAVEGRIVGSGQLNGLGYSYGGNKLTIMPNYGLVCQNKENLPSATWPSCHDYKVRYCCKTPPIRPTPRIRPTPPIRPTWFPWCNELPGGGVPESGFLAFRRLWCPTPPNVH